MQTMIKSYTIEEAIVAAGYADPMTAARQQARMVLLGRLARYQATVKQLEAKWGSQLTLAAQYAEEGQEDFDSDDDYLEWRWYSDAITRVQSQLAAVSQSRDMLRFFEENPYLFISWRVRRYELAQSASHLI